MWEPWRVMIRDNLTTWEEDSVTKRSDCHEWSSLPVWEFATEVAGVTPLEPGWEKIRFAPRPNLAKTGLNTKLNLGANGLASVEWASASEDGKVEIRLKLPHKARVISKLPGGQEKDEGEVESLQLSWTQ